jgi:two-component system, NtrC family, response regulator AtoC
MPTTKTALALVVEDEDSARELLTEVLWHEGYATVEARDCRQAIEVLDELILPSDIPCVVLLDMMLPQASGLGVLDHLKERGADLPVVAMSGSGPALAAARAAGTQGTLAKPFDLDQLVAMVDSYSDIAAAHG